VWDICASGFHKSLNRSILLVHLSLAYFVKCFIFSARVHFKMRAKEQHDPPPEDPESACYRTTTTDRTSEIKCVDVCVEFPSSSSSSDDDAHKNNNNSRVCRSKPYEEETSDSKFLACERACLDAHFASVSLKFRGDEEKMKEYESLRKRECESGCLRVFFPEEKE
jgi:hypothetical protein